MKIEGVTSSVPQPLANYTEAFKVGPWVFAAGQLPSDFKSGVAPEARKGDEFPYYGSDIKLQTRYVLENLKTTFKAAGSSLDDVVKAQVFLMDLDDFAGFDEVWKEYFKTPPPRTTVGTTGLLVKDTLIEIDLIGVQSGTGRKAITSSIPQPLASYAEAFTVGPWVFAAGQLPSDFKSGVAPEARKSDEFPYYGSDIKLQTRYVLENLKTTFKAAGSSLDDVVKAQIFLMDLDDFAGFDEVWKEYFKTPPPRTTVGTTGLLVKDTLIEIDLIGVKSGTERKAITSSIPQPLANYTEAFQAAGLVFAAGQLATDWKHGVAPEAQVNPLFPYYGSDIKLQTRYILENLQTTFKAAGSSLDHVIKAQVFLMDLNDFNGFDEVWREYFKTPPPRTTIGTTGLLVPGTLVEIDLIGTTRD